MKFAVIDNTQKGMTPDTGRGRGYAEALKGWLFKQDYEFVPYNRIVKRSKELRSCSGLILSGSPFDFADSENRLDMEVYKLMSPEFRLIRDFSGPVLGICFGHQLLALAEDFQSGRPDFGEVVIRNMEHPELPCLVHRLHFDSRFEFSPVTELWVQNNHKQEVFFRDVPARGFDVVARSERCAVQAIRHKSRKWFGVQFHPEVGMPSETGKTERHDAAVAEGGELIRDFVHYCLS